MAVKVLNHSLARCNTLKFDGRFTLVCDKDLVKMDIVVIIISFKKYLLCFGLRTSMKNTVNGFVVHH